ncbi:hypothetical protein J6590_005323 [Homalodisca vitripennis]|nr:hypothetical protein J6590_005323 [Homalodisca vitripennis]
MRCTAQVCVAARLGTANSAQLIYGQNVMGCTGQVCVTERLDTVSYWRCVSISIGYSRLPEAPYSITLLCSRQTLHNLFTDKT